MNNNDLFTADFVRSLPLPLQNDPNTLAIAQVIAEQLQITARLISRNTIYARIDELPEKVLDVLAYDLHVDWYDYSYPIKAKRDIIRESVRVHKRLGTKFAVETALGGIHPDSEIEEWFDYGGEPFYFRIILDTTFSRAPAGPAEVIRAVNYYKRLSAHIEEIIYQCHIGLSVRTGQKGFPYRSVKAGTVRAGTVPQRSTGAYIVREGLAIETLTTGLPFHADPTGTRPYTSTGAALHDGAVQVDTAAEGLSFTAAEAGTRPYTSTGAALQNGGIQIDTAAAGLPFTAPESGTAAAGTIPRRSTGAAYQDGAVQVDTAAAGFPFAAQESGNTTAGTKPGTSTGTAFQDGTVQVQAGATAFPFTSPEAGEAGAEKNTPRNAALAGGAFSATASGEGFSYSVKRCGTSRCKS